MTSPRWTRLPVPSVLVLVLVLSRLVSAARSDRNMVSEEYVGATVNATVLDGRGNTVHAMSSDDGTYGQNSPKVDTRGVVIAPAPHHGGTDITLGLHTWERTQRSHTWGHTPAHRRSHTTEVTHSHTGSRTQRRSHTRTPEVAHQRSQT